jgi:hypothetical protein
MANIIELTGEELDLVAGGVDTMPPSPTSGGTATFTFTNTASGATATVSGIASQMTTASSASQAGSFSSSSS